MQARPASNLLEYAPCTGHVYPIPCVPQDMHTAYRMQAWLRSHVISFTFLGDELLPNPDFGFPAG